MTKASHFFRPETLPRRQKAGRFGERTNSMTSDRDNNRLIPIHFRWPLRQIAPDAVELVIPTGGDVPVLNPEFVREFKMTDREIDIAEEKVLRSIAIVD